MLRKVSLSRKKTDGDVPDLNGSRRDKPPRSRAVSETRSDAESEKDGKSSRKMSFGSKSKKRLSSLFSSSSLSSFNSEKTGSSPLKPTDSPLTVSGASTPTRGVSAKYPGLERRGTSPDVNGTANGAGSLRLGTGTEPITASPASISPVPTTAPGPPIQLVADGGRDVNADRPNRQRTASMYSQWNYDDDEVSSDEDQAFLTPSEGLSEVEEEEEEDESAAKTASKPKANGVHGIESLKQNGIRAPVGENVSGTGASTIQRSLPASSETRVRQRSATKGAAAAVDQAAILSQDLDSCRHVLELFLTSRMKEAEDVCFDRDPDGNRLYLQSAHGIIQALKGMMTFDAGDLAAALEICKATSVTASSLRKPSGSIVSRLGGLVRPSQALANIKAMTVLERHAELVYAETSLMKAMLAIISGGDWMGLIREALNMRTAHGIYRSLQQFLDDADKNGFDEDIDMDFRSGVLLGTGTSSLMLSLLPGKVLKIAEVFGYAGDRKVALATLMSAGGWSHDSDLPSYNEQNEGIRRPVCDMILLTFHLVISVLMPVAGVDIPVARNILNYNMKRYPDGIFFLYFQARLHTTQCEPELANKSLQRALDLKLEYIQLQHMCLWDYACNYIMLCNWKGALDCFSILRQESNWSRAVYTYSTAACLTELYEDGDPDAKLEEVDKLMKLIPSLTKKIAGKSLPIEKFVSRKARKFQSQGERLFLPAMELGYVFGCLSHSPRRTLLGGSLPRIDKMLAKLEKSTPETYGNGTEYWDDYCLGHFLRGVVQFVARYQPPEAAPSASVHRPGEPSDDEIDRSAENDFKLCIKHGPDIRLDHWITFHCHFELGKLYARRGDHVQAKKNFDVVMSGKPIEVNHHAANIKGKYSLEGALMLKTHAAIQSLKESEGGR